MKLPIFEKKKKKWWGFDSPYNIRDKNCFLLNVTRREWEAILYTGRIFCLSRSAVDMFLHLSSHHLEKGDFYFSLLF